MSISLSANANPVAQDPNILTSADSCLRLIYT